MNCLERCFRCGKLIANRFPIHSCKPTENFIREQRKKEKGVKIYGKNMVK
ncbi:hypothetical protein ES708_06656 [subsurface metagenome]